MTSPNFLSHIQHTGFIPQPGIGDILGQQFQNLAQTRGVVREQDQRQQQIDQLGQYYQGQINEMQRLRDQQEQQAIAEQEHQRYLMQRRAELDKLYPIPDGADEKTTWEVQSKRALRMAEYGDPMAGPLSNLLNALRPKEGQSDEFVSSPQGIFNKRTGQITAPAPEKPGKTVERTVDLGNRVEYIYTDGSRETKPKGRLAGDGGQGSDIPRSRFEQKLQSDYDRFAKQYTDRLDQITSGMADASLAAKGDGPAQVSLLYSFVRTVDPNRVTDSERELIQKAQSLAGQIETGGKKAFEAQVVAAKLIPNIVAALKRRRDQFGKVLSFKRDSYIKQARDRYKVKDPENLFSNYMDLYGDENGLSTEDAAAAARIDSLVPRPK